MSRIGVLNGFSEGDPEGERLIQALLEGLSQLGWKRDENIRIDVRWGADPARIQQLGKDLVELRPDLIVALSTPATAAVLRQTHTIPVVFGPVSDPLGSGFVKTLARPGGNATGFVNMESSVAGKWLELLKELAPQTSLVAILFNPKTAPFAYYLKLLEAAAPSFALALKAMQVSNVGEIEAEIDEFAKQPNAGLVVLPDVFTSAQPQRDLILARIAQHRIPAVYPDSRFWVRAGGLVSYGVDLTDLERQAAGYIDRILKGAKPQDLPVQLPTKFELAINLKTAKALGLTVPQKLIYTADDCGI
jgi:putative ABC transport system substrate-binding protein